MYNERQQKGFTLIELMIVIAIIGILASVAIPQYQIYTQRTEVTNTLAQIRPIQLAIQEYVSKGGDITTFALTDLDSNGVDSTALADYATGNIGSVAVAANSGNITITFSANAPVDMANETLVISPTVGPSGVVTFGVATTGTSLDIKLRPNL